MSDLAGVGGIEGWLARTDRRLGTFERRALRARVPHLVVSSARPNPSGFQPGVSFFETDTNRTIYVNATQTGYVNALGQGV